MLSCRHRTSIRVMARLRLALLGGFEARLAAGHPVTLARHKVEALLALLALRPGQLHRRDKLAALLWADAPGPGRARACARRWPSLRLALAPAAPCLLERRDAVGLDPAAVDVDVPAFERLLADGVPRRPRRGRVALPRRPPRGAPDRGAAVRGVAHGRARASPRDGARRSRQAPRRLRGSERGGTRGDRPPSDSSRSTRYRRACIVRSCASTSAWDGGAPACASTRSASISCGGSWARRPSARPVCSTSSSSRRRPSRTPPRPRR